MGIYQAFYNWAIEILTPWQSTILNQDYVASFIALALIVCIIAFCIFITFKIVSTIISFLDL